MNALPSTLIEQFPAIHCPVRRSRSKHSFHFNLRSAATFGELSWTHEPFDEMPISDAFAWNNLIQTCLINGDIRRAISTYRQMLLRGVRLDKHTLPRILSASRLSGELDIGKQVHAQAFKLGFASNPYIISALIELYGSLDGVKTARRLLNKMVGRNSVPWTMLARQYLKQDEPISAIDLFYQSLELRIDVDSVALATAIGACGALKSLQDGRNIHHIARGFGLEFDRLVSNSLLQMYSDCGSVKDAREIFDQMPSKDVISWTEIIRAYVKGGGINEGLKLFRQMNENGLKPDPLTISSILPACGRIAAQKQGKEIHAYVLKNGMDLNIIVQNAVMDMYVKSGSIESASTIFSGLRTRDAISWTVMILGYSLHGRGKLGIDLFHEMETTGIPIDQIAYSAALHAASSAFMVEEGRRYFSRISQPTMPHFALYVALLARSGLLEEARRFAEENKIERHAEVLRALLDGCRIHQQRQLGKRIAEQLCDVEPLNADNYVLLSNWYASAEKWGMVDKLRETIRDLGLKTRKAYSWIELRNKVHVFGTGDLSHPRSEKLYWQLLCLMKKMGGGGSETCSEDDFSFHDVEEERECIPIGHSELLALSFGLISTEGGAKIRISKNLRVCRNCHGFAKMVSKAVRREIILRDPSCYHHFKDGFCSCGDLW